VGEATGRAVRLVRTPALRREALGAGLFLAALAGYLLINRAAGGSAVVRALTYEGFAVPVAAGCAIAAWRADAVRLPRRLLAGAAVATMAADVAWDLDATGVIALASHPTLTALMYVPAYALLFATVLVSGSRWGDGSLAAALETVIVAGGAATAGYPYLISPYVDLTQTGTDLALGIVSPVGDILVLSGLALLVLRMLGTRVVWLLTAGMLAWLVGDHQYRMQAVTDAYTPGGWVDVFWLAQYAALAAAMRRVAWPDVERRDHPPRATLAKVLALAGAALSAPVWLIITQTTFDAARAREVLVPLSAATVVVVALVMTRFALLLRAYATMARDMHVTASERQRLTDTLRHQAFHDALTGLPNRAHLAMVASAMPPDRQAALAFIDLDDFKNVNDTLGHEAGDALLCAVAERLRSHTRAGDLVARLGGDEFAVLLPGSSTAAAHRRIQHVLDAISAPVEIGGVQVRIAASVGVSPLTGDYDAALASADIAMYSVKKAGKGRAGVYDEAMCGKEVGDAALAADLHRAIQDGGLHLEYQPVVSLQDGRLTGCEALVRWLHPRLGPLLPGTFLSVAEDRGMAVDLDRSVLSTAVRQIAHWRRDGFTVKVNVNASAAFIGEATFVDEVLDMLRRHDVPGELLTVEVTEQSLLSDVAGAAAKLGELRSHGVRVALDDFGTGYSGLAYLQELPVDVLKLDKSFVRVDETGVPVGPLLGVVVGLGHALGMQVLAEGVESVVQEQTLRGIGCDLGQGWLWSKALPAGDLRAWATQRPVAQGSDQVAVAAG